MAQSEFGRILEGEESLVRQSYDAFLRQPVDLDLVEDGEPADERQTTLAHPASVTGPGTFFGRAQRTLEFHPSAEPGWWIDRCDLPDSLPIRVGIENVWTTGAVVSNIVLRSGSPHNYLRMVEHIIALKAGMDLDNLLIRVNSGDPPLFDRSSMDLVEAIENAGIKRLDEPASYWRVKETVTMLGAHGNFLTMHPPKPGSKTLSVDCAVDFPNAIGRQRIRFVVTADTFRKGAFARTNTTLWKMLYCMTVGKLFADIRNLGYSRNNVLVAGPRRYVNESRLVEGGKSLEAAWHRAALDLLAALALIGDGRLAGHIVSYKAGHVLDCQMVSRLHRDNLLEKHS